MRRLVIIASVAVLAIARPEMYKETEDFQYSRSSSDDGTKSGYYGARRGNMGGNYERAHNMDGLAQHQMSSAVRQVEGELGEGANMRTGSVYTSANSRGIYGSGNYDLSNLKGRNFAESASSFDNSHSSLTSQNSGYRGHSYTAAQNAGYSGFTKSAMHSSGHQSADYLGQYAQNENAHIQDAQQAANQYSYGKHEASGSQYEYHSHSGSQAQNQYDSSKSNLQHAYDSNVYGRHDMPVRVVVRPGSTIRVPITAKAQDVSTYRDASYNANSINSEAEVLDNNDQQFNISPANKPKHYESSYSYRKEWEKHHAQPVTVLPTENPFPKNSELYEDSRLLQNAKSQYNVLDASSLDSSKANVAHSNSYRAHTKSSFNKSGYREESQSQGVSAGGLSSAYTLGGQNSQQTADVNNLVENINSKPKSYQSSYSYHKSWERRGDPYVIKPLSPVGGNVAGQESQRLVSASANQGAFSSHQYGSRYNQAHSVYSHDGVDCDCDENGHIRVVRSIDDEQKRIIGQYHELDQQVQDKWDDLGQQTQEFGQLTQNKWDDLGQQTQDFGQMSQDKWDDLGQQTQDFGKLTQNKWDDLGQQTQDFGELTQKKWDDLGQQTQDFGKLTQNKWDDLGQQTQDFSQLSQNKWDDLGQQTQDFSQLTQKENNDAGAHSQWDKLETLGQETQNQWVNPQHGHGSQRNKLQDFGQHTQNKYDNLESLGQQTQDQFDIGQQVNNNWDDQQNFNQQTLMGGLSQPSQDNKFEHFHEQTVSQDNISGFNQYTIGDRHDKHKQGTNFFIPNNPFDESPNHKDEGNIGQQNKEDSFSAHSFAYSHNLDKNKDSADSLADTQQPDTDDILSLLIQDHFKNFDSKFTNKWDFTDSDNTDQRVVDVSKSENPFSISHKFEDQWKQSQGQHSVSKFDQTQSHYLTNIDSKSSTTEKSFKEAMPVGTFSQKPRIRVSTSTTTMKPKYRPVNNVIPAGPIDIGRGDIGAEDTEIESTDKEIVNTHMFTLQNNRKPNKTPQEIESLSMTLQDQKHNTDYMADKFDSIDKNKLQHENAYSNSFKQEHTSYTTLRNNLNIGDEQSAYSVSNKNHKYLNMDKPLLYNGKPVTDTSNEMQNNTSDFDVQQNTDQQFEDFSQSIQSSMDLGQEVQSSWQPSNDFVQHDTQQLENFGQLNAFDSDNHGENSDQQLQHFGRENLQESQKFADIEKETSWRQSDSQHVIHDKLRKPQENIVTEIPSSRSAPVLENFDVKEKVEPHKPITQEEEAIVTPVEVTTEKQGFWKSVGSKVSSAKDSVVSWFKG